MRREHQKGVEGQDGKGQKEAPEKVWKVGDPETNREEKKGRKLSCPSVSKEKEEEPLSSTHF